GPIGPLHRSSCRPPLTWFYSATAAWNWSALYSLGSVTNSVLCVTGPELTLDEWTACRDVQHLREILTGIAGKLGAIGLRVDRRKAGIRVVKAR
ncbi:hypothetical protein, partial [Methylobacterium cerastii]|uniref:hypothetical protein n=1 Tax=Methylobacterium cerastii TaxID=932741 RepID=UPI001EE1B413